MAIDIPELLPAVAPPVPTAWAPPAGLESRRDSWRRRLLAGADILGVAIALLVTAATAGGPHWAALAVLAPAWLVLNKLLGLYDRDDALIQRSSLDELPRILQSVVFGTVLLVLAAPAFLPEAPGRAESLLFGTLAFVLVPLLRGGARTLVRRVLPAERCLILGTCPDGQLMARKLHSHPEYGMHLTGFLDEVQADLPPVTSAPVLGGVGDLEAVAARHGIERIIIAYPAKDDALLELVQRAKTARLKITIVPRLHEVMGRSVQVDEVEGMTVLSLDAAERSRSTLVVKRAIDVFGAGLGLVLLSPVLVLIGIAVKLSSRGPVFYRSTRIGRDQGFDMFKFRTMIDGADAMKASLLALNEADGIMFKMADDPRVTRVGRFLRRTSLDELPQLWNVLRGEMSLVGPRPLVPDEDDHVLGLHRDRLALTPGLTGPWQVSGRTAIPFHEMVKMDYLYVAEWSLWNDIRLLLRTLPVVLMRRGA